VEDRQAIGVGGSKIEIVQNRQHGTACRRQLARNLHHHLLVTEIERGGWFVEQQNRCFLAEHTRQRDARLLTS